MKMLETELKMASPSKKISQELLKSAEIEVDYRCVRIPYWNIKHLGKKYRACISGGLVNRKTDYYKNSFKYGPDTFYLSDMGIINMATVFPDTNNICFIEFNKGVLPPEIKLINFLNKVSNLNLPHNLVLCIEIDSQAHRDLLDILSSNMDISTIT
jgi:hypothetical protein